MRYILKIYLEKKLAKFSKFIYKVIVIKISKIKMYFRIIRCIVNLGCVFLCISCSSNGNHRVIQDESIFSNQELAKPKVNTNELIKPPFLKNN